MGVHSHSECAELRGMESNHTQHHFPSDQQAKAEFTQSSLEYWLMIEYKNLVPAHRRPSGVYVMPAFGNMLVWYGVIFVHHGYYRKGIFKFRIELPRHYPNVRPEVFFIDQVHH